MADLTPAQKFYKDKTIFITGGSGFMGKVLVEKLLYSCSELKEIILILRSKKGKTPEARLEDMWKLPLFQRIRDEKPQIIKKVKCFSGDVCSDNLGLDAASLQYVKANTEIIFHLAATLKLEGNLKDAIEMNTTGTKRTLDIAREMKKLVSFVHLSTAFCNCDEDVMYEKIYEYPHKPEDLINLVQWMDLKTLEKVTPNLIKPHPNTYTYSKRLAEILVRDAYPDLPVTIARPSIVSPSALEPVQGWVDNLNGPTGLMVGAARGVIRSMLIDDRFKSEIIPVDYAISGIIMMAYQQATAIYKEESVPVFNVTIAEHRKLCWKTVIELSKKIGYQYPLEIALWYPDGCITTNRFHHTINVILFHWLPAYIIDFVLFCLGKKTFMIRVQRKVSTGLNVLQFFSMRNWIFKSERFASVWQKLGDEDKKLFNMDMDIKEGAEEYMQVCLMGGREYLMKEPIDNLPKARRNMKILYVLDRLCKILAVGLIFYWLLNATGMMTSLLQIFRLKTMRIRYYDDFNLYISIQNGVSPSASEPVPGWVDNLNGPTGVMLGAGKGVIRTMLCDGDNLSEIIPVDYAINGIIVIAYDTYMAKVKPPTIPVYTLTAPDSKKVPWKYVLDLGKTLYEQYPCSAGLWYPGGGITTNKLVFKINQILFMWLPAYFIDFLLFIFGQKRFMIYVQNRISVGLEVLQFFTMRRWVFHAENYYALWDKLTSKEKQIFNMDFENVDVPEYMKTCVLGGRQYVLKEPLHTLPRSRTQAKIQFVVDRVCKILIVGLALYWVLNKLGVWEMLGF